MKTTIPTRIDANRDRISRIADLHEFARLVFPAKNASDLRAAMILIFLTLKHSGNSGLTSRELNEARLEKAPNLSQKTLWKARATLSRLGLIERREMTFWRLSSRFQRSMHTLGDKVSNFMNTENNKLKETMLLDLALAECQAKKEK